MVVPITRGNWCVVCVKRYTAICYIGYLSLYARPNICVISLVIYCHCGLRIIGRLRYYRRISLRRTVRTCAYRNWANETALYIGIFRLLGLLQSFSVVYRWKVHAKLYVHILARTTGVLLLIWFEGTRHSSLRNNRKFSIKQKSIYLEFPAA